MSDDGNPYRRNRDPDPDNPYARRTFDGKGRPTPIPNNWTTGGESPMNKLSVEDIKAIAVAVVDEMERRKNG